MNAIKAHVGSKCMSVTASGFGSSLCPSMGFIRLDALRAEDWPFRISANSVFIVLTVDLNENTVSVHSYGSLYFNQEDKEKPENRYFAMQGIYDVTTPRGVKKWRKTQIKNVPTIGKKIAKHFNDVMEIVDEYTGGYPYGKK